MSSNHDSEAEHEAERSRQHASDKEKERGNAYYRIGDYKEAVDCYTTAISYAANNALLPANRAMAYLKMERYEEAAIDCDRALLLDDTYAKAYLRRGTARMHLGQLEEAKQDYDQTLNLEPSNEQALAELKKLEQLMTEREDVTKNKTSDSEKHRDEQAKGNDYYRIGRYHEAVECYSAAIACDSNNAILPANRAMAYLKMEKYEEAARDCDRALSLDDTYSKAYLRRGTARMHLGQLEEAKQDFDKVLKLEPLNKQAMVELNKIEQLMKEIDDEKGLMQHCQIDVVERVVEFLFASNAPKETIQLHLKEAFNRLYMEGDTLYQNGAYCEAFPYYNAIINFNNECIKFDPTSNIDNHVVRSATMKRIRCVIKLPISDPEIRVPALQKALDECIIAFDQDQRNTDVLLLAAKVCVELEMLEQAAVFVIRSEHILGTDPEVAEIKQQIAEENKRLGGADIDWNKLYNEVTQSEQDNELLNAHVDMGNEYYTSGRYNDAVDCYTTAIGYDANNAIIQGNRAMAYLKMEKYEEAVRDCDRSLSLDDTYANAYLGRGVARMRLGQLEEAKQDYDQTLNLEPSNEQALAELKKLEQLMTKREDAMKNKTSDNEKHLDEQSKGNDYYKIGRYKEAVECYSAAIACDSNNAILPANRAMAYLKMEKYEEAVRDCDRALSLDDTYSKAYLRRGTARMHLGQLEEAKHDFDKVLKLAPSNKQAAAGLKKIEQLMKEREDEIRLKRRLKIDVVKSEVEGLLASNAAMETITPHIKDLFDLLYMEGDTWYQKGSFCEAFPYYNDIITFNNESIKVDPTSNIDNHVVRSATMKRIKCVIHFPKSDPVRVPALLQALDECRIVIDQDPRNTDMLLLAAKVYVGLEMLEQAVILVMESERILGTDPDIEEIKLEITEENKRMGGEDFDWNDFYNKDTHVSTDKSEQDDELIKTHADMAKRSKTTQKRKSKNQSKRVASPTTEKDDSPIVFDIPIDGIICDNIAKKICSNSPNLGTVPTKQESQKTQSVKGNKSHKKKRRHNVIKEKANASSTGSKSNSDLDSGSGYPCSSESSSIKVVGSTCNQKYENKPSQRESVQDSDIRKKTSLPYTMKIVCLTCWRRDGQQCGRSQTDPDVCGNAKESHSWNMRNKAFLVNSNISGHLRWVRIRPMVKGASPLHSARLCRFAEDCAEENTCQHPHSNEEIRVWAFQRQHKVMNPENLEVWINVSSAVGKQNNETLRLCISKNSKKKKVPTATLR